MCDESRQQNNTIGYGFTKALLLAFCLCLLNVYYIHMNHVYFRGDVYNGVNDQIEDKTNFISSNHYDADDDTIGEFFNDTSMRDGFDDSKQVYYHDYKMLEKYRERRISKFYSWFQGNTTDRLKTEADINGTILDFAISGFAKCGTTSMEANLGYLAPMPIADVCTPVHQTVYYSYINWPKTYSNNIQKILRGTKCPRTVGWLDDFSTYLPKTLIIVGIRHPILFFQSFWNMMADFNTRNIRGKSPYDFMGHCEEGNSRCNFECSGGQLLCLHKTRFHLPLARIGKTLLTDTERELLAPNDKDGGQKLTNHNIRNPIFLYELDQMKDDQMWDELAKALKVNHIPHDIHEGNNAVRVPSDSRINICDAQYDDFRAKIMPHAYNMSIWLCEYLVPVAKNTSRNDLFITNPDHFCELVKQYVDDPCNRLVRYSNGTYGLGKNSSSI